MAQRIHTHIQLRGACIPERSDGVTGQWTWGESIVVEEHSNLCSSPRQIGNKCWVCGAHRIPLASGVATPGYRFVTFISEDCIMFQIRKSGFFIVDARKSSGYRCIISKETRRVEQKGCRGYTFYGVSLRAVSYQG